MAILISNVLDVLGDYGIQPEEESSDLPEIGQIEEGESVYSTSLEEVLGVDEEAASDHTAPESGDPRLREWSEEVERIIEDPTGRAQRAIRALGERYEPPEPHCAWYCPMHFYGYGWGIYMREDCILSLALDIAGHVQWPSVSGSRSAICRQLLRSAFYVLFLHEQFHHKVESLGLRLLVLTGSDRYRPYKRQVYRKTYLTADCLEEGLANADSYRRLGERRYVQRVSTAIRRGLRSYLKWSIPRQPPGYSGGLNFLSEQSYRRGLFGLQTQMRDGVFPHTAPLAHWSVAPNVITALADVAEEIYVILPRGGRPQFAPTSVDLGATVSSSALERALTKHHGYKHVPGGKGSHVKLAKSGSPTIILPGNRPVLSPGVVKQALNAVGGHPISQLPELLAGRLSAHA